MSDSVLIMIRRGVDSSVLAAIARDRGWPLTWDVPPAHSTGSQRVWDPRESVRVGWVEENTTGACAVRVVGDPALAAELEALLPSESRTALLERAGRDDLPGALDALRALAILEDSAFTPELCAALRRWMPHENRAVRRAVIHLCRAGGAAILPAVEARCTEDIELADAWTRLRDDLAAQ
jgi:hypothetical protein